MKVYNLLGLLVFSMGQLEEISGLFRIDFKVLRGNDKRDISFDERQHVSKRDSTEMELRNRQTFDLANIKVGSNNDEMGVLIDTGSSDLWVMANNLKCEISSPTTSPTSTSSSTSSGSTTSTEFEADILDAHNEKRALHGVKSLEWNDSLALYAAEYANSSFSCENVALIHSGGPYGENLAAGYLGGYDPVDVWYDEIELYNFGNPGFNETTGHFTQVVWKSTSQVGCARVICDNEWGQYTICEYSNTRGNIIGINSQTGRSFFSENVLEPTSN